MAPKYSKGQQVRYKPVGGPDSNTSESTGTIQSVDESGDQPRYDIENANTGKTSPVSEDKILGTA